MTRPLPLQAQAKGPAMTEKADPGLTGHEPGFYPIQTMNEWATKCVNAESAEVQIERVAHMLALAFEAGAGEARRKIRLSLGLPANGH